MTLTTTRQATSAALRMMCGLISRPPSGLWRHSRITRIRDGARTTIRTILDSRSRAVRPGFEGRASAWAPTAWRLACERSAGTVARLLRGALLEGRQVAGQRGIPERCEHLNVVRQRAPRSSFIHGDVLLARRPRQSRRPRSRCEHERGIIQPVALGHGQPALGEQLRRRVDVVQFGVVNAGERFDIAERIQHILISPFRVVLVLKGVGHRKQGRRVCRGQLAPAAPETRGPVPWPPRTRCRSPCRQETDRQVHLASCLPAHSSTRRARRPGRAQQGCSTFAECGSPCHSS